MACIIYITLLNIRLLYTHIYILYIYIYVFVLPVFYIYIYTYIIVYYGQDEIRTHKMINIRRLAIGYTSPVAACPCPCFLFIVLYFYYLYPPSYFSFNLDGPHIGLTLSVFITSFYLYYYILFIYLT